MRGTRLHERNQSAGHCGIEADDSTQQVSVDSRTLSGILYHTQGKRTVHYPKNWFKKGIVFSCTIRSPA